MVRLRDVDPPARANFHRPFGGTGNLRRTASVTFLHPFRLAERAGTPYSDAVRRAVVRMDLLSRENE
jgi:hypothetical protein